MAGLEPARRLRQGILSPRCLPFHHIRMQFLYYSIPPSEASSYSIAKDSFLLCSMCTDTVCGCSCVKKQPEPTNRLPEKFFLRIYRQHVYNAEEY